MDSDRDRHYQTRGRQTRRGQVLTFGLRPRVPQTNGICERFHKTVLNEFYRVTFRKKIYKTLDELQTDLDAWLRLYNEQRPHQGRWCYGKTPMQTFVDSIPLAKEKMIAA